MSHCNRRSQKLVREALERDGWTCVCCGLIGHEVHHIHAFWCGGEDTLNNMATLCTACHEMAPDNPNRFLSYQANGGALRQIWKLCTAEARASLFFRLPWDCRFQDLVEVWDWQKVRTEWEDRLGYVNRDRKPENPEVAKLKDAIVWLMDLKDPDLEPAIQTKLERLKDLTSNSFFDE